MGGGEDALVLLSFCGNAPSLLETGGKTASSLVGTVIIFGSWMFLRSAPEHGLIFFAFPLVKLTGERILSLMGESVLGLHRVGLLLVGPITVPRGVYS